MLCTVSLQSTQIQGQIQSQQSWDGFGGGASRVGLRSPLSLESVKKSFGAQMPFLPPPPHSRLTGWIPYPKCVDLALQSVNST